MTISRATVAAVLSLALGGCQGILDLKDLDSVDVDDVWNDAALAEAYVNRIYYDNLPGWSTDDAAISEETTGGGSYMYGQLTESSVNYWPYDDIRRINILLAEIDKGTIDTVLTKKFKGEAYFFRAWRYWEMVKRYGGVPLILEPQQLADDLLVERNPTSQVVSQIVSDLDRARSDKGVAGERGDPGARRRPWRRWVPNRPTGFRRARPRRRRAGPEARARSCRTLRPRSGAPRRR